MRPVFKAPLCASLLLHAFALWALFYTQDSPQANRLLLQGDAQALTVYMVAAASPTPTEERPEKEVIDDAAIPPEKSDLRLSPSKEGERRAAARAPKRRPSVGHKKRINKAVIAKQSAAVNTAQAAQQGKDREDSEQGKAAVTTQREMVGTGDNEHADYAARLRSEIELHKRYPRQARQTGSGGSATVRFRVEPDGRISAPRLVGSSGNRSLDRAAVQAVLASAPVGPRPVGFGPDVSVKIRFNLLAQ